jgi:hypothetical protein
VPEGLFKEECAAPPPMCAQTYVAPSRMTRGPADHKTFKTTTTLACALRVRYSNSAGVDKTDRERAEKGDNGVPR